MTDCCLVDLIDVTGACEDQNSKLVEVITVADIYIRRWADGKDAALDLTVTSSPASSNLAAARLGGARKVTKNEHFPLPS